MKQRLLVIFSVLIVATLLFFPTPEKKTSKKDSNLVGPYEMPPIEKVEVERQRDQPHLALQQEFEMFKDDKLGFTPTQRLVEAYEAMKDKFESEEREQSAIPGVQWVERGPNNVGGRTRTLMFDPNDPDSKKLWAGAVTGGLWYIDDITSDQDQWQLEDGIMTNLAISSMTYDPTNTQVFYVGTGMGFSGIVRGAGIWKSADGGATWNQLTSTVNSNFFFVQKVEVTPTGTVLAATTTGIHRSTDGGTSWTNVQAARQADIEIASNGTIYASRGVNSTGGIVKSTDDGLNWTNITPPNTGNAGRTELAVAPSDPNIVYAVADGAQPPADVEYFKKTIDGGETWTDVTIPIYTEQAGCAEGTSHFTRGQAFFDLILNVHPEDPDLVYAGGISTHRSKDGGETWELITYWANVPCAAFAHADVHDIQFNPNDFDMIVLGTDGGIDYSPDAGDATVTPSFDRRVRGYNTVLFYYGAMVNQAGSNAMLAGAQDNGTQRFTSIGMNSTISALGGDGTFCSIDPNNANNQLASFVFNTYDYSTDGGLTFTRIAQDQSSGRFINPTDIDWEAGILYSAAGSNELGRLSGLLGNPGNFTKIPVSISGQISAVRVSPYTANRIFVGIQDNTNGGKIFMIDDANLATPTVTEITGNLDSNRGSFLRSIDIGVSDDQVLITYGNFGSTSVYETTDGGTNWVDKEDNLPDIPVMWGLYNPQNRQQVLLATHLGVWSTNDITAGSPNWEPSNNGLASVRVDHLVYRPADETVAAATHGRGLFTSNVFASTVRADFKTDQIVGYVGVPVNFEDASLLPGDSWSWDFGDGNTSTNQNASNTYATPGTYDVTLSIANGADDELKVGYVTILPTLPTPYAAADGGDFESNPEHFTSAALLNGIDVWERGVPGNHLNQTNSGTNLWKTNLDADIGDFGFNHSSALYTPAFDMSNMNQDYTMSFNLSMESFFCNVPFALKVEYSVNGGSQWQRLGSSAGELGDVNWYNRGTDQGCAILRLIFEDQIGWTASSNAGDFNVLTQTKLNFLAGESNVSFRIVFGAHTNINSNSGDPYATDGFAIDDFEILATEPTADFTSDETIAFQGVPIQFTYASNGADSFLWDFGDNTTSTDENPVHAYNTSGAFTVQLTTTTNGQDAVETKTDFIRIIPTRALPYVLTDGGNMEVNTEDFTAFNNVGTPFELGVSAITGKDGTASGSNAWVTGLAAAQYADDTRAALVSPLFGLSQQGKLYTLQFKAKYSFEDTWDGFIVRYTTDKGLTWIKLNDNVEDGWYNTTSNAQSIFGASVPMFSGSTNGEFETYTADVTFLFGEDVAFQLLFLTDQNAVDVGMAVDDFEITLADAPATVADFTFTTGTGCSGQFITFTDASTGGVESYSWDFGQNATPQTATGPGPHTVTYMGTGTSTVSLDIVSVFGQPDSESKANIISTSATHTPSFTEEDNGTSNIARLVASDGDAYQWYLLGEEVVGATSQILLTEERGSYTVDVTVGGCTVRTGPQSIIAATEADDAFQKGVTIFPNPVQDIVNVKVSNADVGQLQIVFHSISGKMISNTSVQKSSFDEEYQFDLGTLKSGTYLVEIISDKGRAVKRVFKEK